ncbi:hypothetical protein A4H97_00640 [Niastella yeongjuensis]|uniref:TPM domain-containing protein n=1 Tax=Niastella yeongjuensis TaxID=354355 RepID=A0A1V9EWX7_9BACT|nr:TPM domain-containing protein [Niastella yeongjuensis]OQP50384.1 hypothetical protein A4H97_00640 [Niastella yeongjuensis]SEN36806.1 uncharacterized protein SAMN05660816_00820 [Niastella yeongjuensis]
MRTLLLVSLFLVSHVLLAWQYDPEIKNKPRFAREVNDFGDLLTWGQESDLEDELDAYRKRTGNAIVIITLKTLPLSLKETSVQYYKKWGMGAWYARNKILLLVSRSPRRVRITSGRGFDNILADRDCQRIIDEKITPAFRAFDYFTGLIEGVHDIEAILGNEEKVVHAPTPVYVTPKPPPQQTPENEVDLDSPGLWVIRGIIVFVVIIWLRLRYLKRNPPPLETYSSAANPDAETEENVT